MKNIRLLFVMLAIVSAVMAVARETLVLQRRASEGDKEAMYRLAEGYYYGNEEVSRDIDKAFYWYKKAAGKGYVPAIRDLGLCYLSGDGVKVNYNKAWSCFEKAAKKGDAHSAYFMSQMYKEGMYGKKKEDLNKAYLRQLVKAADMGSEDALYEWGMLHYTGSGRYGINQDKRSGAALILDAASKGSPDALWFAGKCYRDGSNGVKRDMGKAFDSFYKAVKLGNDSALCDLGMCYMKGLGTKTDHTEAYRYLEIAERNGIIGASRVIGDMYANGIDVKYNPEYAMMYYEKAEQDGDRLALLSQATLMLHSEGSTRDPERAFRIFNDAVAEGSGLGFAGLGDCYLAGLATSKSDAKALEYFNKAFDRGSTHAAAQIGNMYYKGSEVTPRNYEKAMKYYRVFLTDPLAVPREVRGATYRNLAECYRFGRGVAQDNTKAADFTRKAYEDGEEALKVLIDKM